MTSEFELDAPPRRPAPKGVQTVEELRLLNEDDIVTGYMAGLKNEPDFSCGDRAYWHGFLNGMVDGGHAKGTPEQAELARLYVASGALQEDVKRWQAAARH